MAGGGFDGLGEIPHDPRRRRNLRHGLSFHPQRDQKTRNLRRGGLPAHDDLHGRAHLAPGEVLARHEFGDGRLEWHAMIAIVQFLANNT